MDAIEMNSLRKNIDLKLKNYGLSLFDELDNKSQERLIQIEEFIIKNREEVENYILQAKKLKLSISSVADSQDTKFTRKTVYNDAILKKFLEKSIEDEPDYFNEMKLKKLTEKLGALKEQYDKVINNILDVKILDLTIKEYKKEINRLCDINQGLNSVLSEKERTIQYLKSNNKHVLDNINFR
ncbi:hypothetical protein [Clostridium magnum]|uniref:Uncharacterized protein n=1 Tax=Clostridium magnum DSM 2767 TaxID=1121326 RepID=A0A162R4R4_9CLOT|nr:hypothetical protein [Clostridium magnum]KZL89420.1 hypothetical protein CLMAG_53240 [Clostridium magnum DSM 2767]SHI20475.1 hypothetical protein SAMN02745944_03195 [Clostridium magnum DSM 2767]